MEQLTNDLAGVGVYLDAILVSGDGAADHLQNLEALLTCLSHKGPRCHLEKCTFAQPVVDYLGHPMSHEVTAKRPKLRLMPYAANAKS